MIVEVIDCTHIIITLTYNYFSPPAYFIGRQCWGVDWSTQSAFVALPRANSASTGVGEAMYSLLEPKESVYDDCH